jgi:flagellar hook-associated protein 3 FlgL
MRITDGMRMDSLARTQATLDGQFNKAAKVAASGARVGSPSDDPVGAAQLARVQASLDKAAEYRSTVQTVRGDVELAESTLSSAQSVLERAKEIALQGASGSLTASERGTMAEEVKQLREQLIAAANARGAQGYLFGGTRSDTAPFAPNGAYGGDANTRTVEIAKGVVANTSMRGDVVFGPAGGGRDIFADMAALETSLRANDVAGIRTAVDAMGDGHKQIVTARADAGLTLTRFEMADAAHGELEFSMSRQRSDIADADPFQSYAHLMSVKQTLERAIEVARTTLSTVSSLRAQ